jgi:hypothetical protein
MTRQTTDFWFPLKTYGWGWGLPVKWQGWVVLLAYFVLLIGGIRYFAESANLVVLTIYLLTVTAGLIAICIWKGERPLKWRWGGK